MSSSKHYLLDSLGSESIGELQKSIQVSSQPPLLSFPFLSHKFILLRHHWPDLKPRARILAPQSFALTNSLLSPFVDLNCDRLSLQNAILPPLLFSLRAHLKLCAGRNKSPVCFYAVITVSQACNPQRSDNDIAPAFITWRRGERENADFEQMNTLTFMQ